MLGARTYVCTDGHLRPTLLGRLCWRSLRHTICACADGSISVVAHLFPIQMSYVNTHHYEQWKARTLTTLSRPTVIKSLHLSSRSIATTLWRTSWIDANGSCLTVITIQHPSTLSHWLCTINHRHLFSDNCSNVQSYNLNAWQNARSALCIIMRPIATDVARGVVCVLVTWMCCAKTAEPIQLPFGGWLGWVQQTIYRMGVQIKRIHSQPQWARSRRCGLLPNCFGHLL